MSNENRPVKSTRGDVARFLDQVARTPVRTTGEQGRLIFALDATASREPTWDSACRLQGDMFVEAGKLGGLAVQLCYYRGFREFFAGEWCTETGTLLRQMTAVRCLGGETQIERVLDHARTESQRKKVQAVVFIGDALEEDADRVCHKAGELGLINVPVFLFQEGRNASVERVFRQVAKLSGGAYAPFDRTSADELRALLSAVAVFAAGGRKALEDFSHRAGKDVLKLTQQLK